jgi:LCP family protein required for cell wall assembly
MERTRRRRRVKWKRVFLFLFLFMIIGIGAYSAYEYTQGVMLGKDGNSNTKKAYAFNGEEVKFGKINVLLLGSDTRGEEHSRTDSIMIAHYDQNTHKAKLISIMRDTFVDIPGHGKEKINAAYAFGGPELLRKTIKENFNLDVNYYAVVDFKGFSKIADIVAPDGINVDVPQEMSYGIDTTIEPGKQVLHGDKLLGYVRFRHDSLSDFGRVQRQQEVVGKLKDEALSVGTLVKLPKIMGVVGSYVDTNLDNSTIFSLGKDVITNQSGDIKTMRIPMDGSFRNETLDGIGAVLRVNLDENQAAIKKFLAS